MSRLSVVGQADVEGLAGHLAASERIAGAAFGSADARDRQQVALVHNHLPPLEDAGLVDWNCDRGVVSPSCGVLTNELVGRVLAVEGDEGDLTSVLDALSARNRREVLSVLAVHHEASVADLARAMARGRPAGSIDEGTDRIRHSLVHTDLPKLEEADLVEYDANDAQVTYRDHPAVQELWPTDAEPSAGRL